MRTIKAKMGLVTLFVVLVLGGLIIFMTASTNRNYKALQVSECQSIVDFESERINNAIRALEANARELALIGELYYGYSEHNDRSAAFGRTAVIRNFTINIEAVGGGIWYVPYSLEKDRELLCYYAFNTEGRVVYDASFESAGYHYPTQGWYTTISAGVRDGGETTTWTAPYIDDTGTHALMTTVGCGIFDRLGEFVGMSTVDWQLTDIAERIAAIRPTAGSFALFADQASDFILALSDPAASGDMLGRSLSDLAWLPDAMDGDGRMAYGGVDYLCFQKTLDNDMVIVINVPEAELFREVNRTMAVTVVIMVLASLLILAVTTLLLNRFINKPVAYLSARAAEIGAGDLDTVIQLRTKDELGRLAATFNQMTISVKEYIQNLNAVTAEKERIGAELNVATEIQASMLPSIFPAFPDRSEFDVYATMKPAKEVGGDFYDFFLVDEDNLAVVIADVSGKGVPAALFMVIAKTLIKNYAQLGIGAQQVFTTVNNLLCENNEVGMFVTAFMGILNIRTGLFTYVNAGHNPPLLRRAGGRYEYLKVRPGFVLAGMEGILYMENTAELEPGDSLFCYTDGVTEAENLERELYGEARLEAALNAEPGAGLPALLAAVKADIDAFVGQAPQFDDITMLGLVFQNGEADQLEYDRDKDAE